MQTTKEKQLRPKLKENGKKSYMTYEKKKIKVFRKYKVKNYIDPGTGSMLFSVLIGLVTAVFFSAKALIIKLKFLFSNGGMKAKRESENIAIYSEGKQYWNVFKPILDELEKRKVKAKFYTSSKDDFVFNQNYEYIESEYIGEGNKAFFRLMFVEAQICLMTTPGLDVYQLKRSKGIKHYSHILHAVDDATNYRLFGLDFFDSVLLSGEYQKEGIRELEEKRGIKEKELVVIGSTYLDELNNKIKNLPPRQNNRKTILLAPSWGEEGMLKKYGKKLLEKFINTDWHVIIRPHPQSLKVESETIAELQEYTKDKNFEWDFEVDNIHSLSNSDIMITDFSGIMFDYAFLFNKPFLYINQNFNPEIYDFSDCDKESWKFRTAREIGIELTLDNIENINSLIEEALKSEVLKTKRQIAKETAWYFMGESGSKAAEFLIQKSKELSNC